MENLKFDPMKVDTALAEKFLKDHNNFEDWPLSGKYWLIKKYPNERDEYDETGYEELEDEELEDVKPESITRAHLGRKLAVKIEANEVLFSQLEYKIRKTDAVDVNNNIKLITQHMQSCDLSSWNGDRDHTMHITMDEETPLYALGCVAIALYSSMHVTIVTPQKMAPLCYLFSELCSELGWKNLLSLIILPLESLNWEYEIYGGWAINLFGLGAPIIMIELHLQVISVYLWKIPLIFVHGIVEYKKVMEHPLRVVKNRELGCTAVVTESADIDSALDLFINSSVTAPWKLQRIFVQESIYDEVKDALAWKSKREQVDSCADAFVTNGKIFLCDTLSAERGGTGGDAARVSVEAYRTAKEVIALLAQHPSPCLSVWAADSQHSHELALAAPASLVWVNDYAAFDGPPKASLPVYEKMYSVCSYSIDGACLENLKRLRNPWTKLTENERVDSIMNALQDFRSAQSQGSDEAVKMQDAIHKGLKDSFASVHGGRFWIGVERSSKGVVVIDVSSSLDLLKTINTTINGGAAVYCTDNEESEFLVLLQFLEKAGVPVTKYCKDDPEDNINIKHDLIYRKLKVVSTNFGTIFAN